MVLLVKKTTRIISKTEKIQVSSWKVSTYEKKINKFNDCETGNKEHSILEENTMSNETVQIILLHKPVSLFCMSIRAFVDTMDISLISEGQKTQMLNL